MKRIIASAMAAMLFMCLVLAAALAAGCEVPAYVAHVIAGPRPIPAVYQLPDRKTLVFVDDRARQLPAPDLSSLLAAKIQRDLRDHKAVTSFVEPDVLDDLRARHSDFAEWPIDRVGREVHVEQVIYVLVQDLSMIAEDIIVRPSITLRIKVVDVASGVRQFPEESAVGYPLQHRMFYRDVGDAPQSTRLVLVRRLMEETGPEVARLFYKHKKPDVGSNLPR